MENKEDLPRPEVNSEGVLNNSQEAQIKLPLHTEQGSGLPKAAEIGKESNDPTLNNEKEIARLKNEILVSGSEREDREASLLEKIRTAQRYETAPVVIEETDKIVIEETAANLEDRLKRNYQPGFGVFPCSVPKENFYEQVWSRDFAHAAGNYFANAEPAAVSDSLATIFRNQRADGALPLRTETRYSLVQIVPGIGPLLAKPLFNLLHAKSGDRRERPAYEGQDFSGAEDTIPAILIASGEYFMAGEEGREFVKRHWPQLKKAVDFFIKKTDTADGLANITRDNPDWCDSLYRKGKLGTINVWWTRGLRLMKFMAGSLGFHEDEAAYDNEFQKVKESVMEKLYDKEGAYFRAKEKEDRVDTTASIFGALYFLSPEEAVRVEETLEGRVRHSSGLKNFDPPYEQKDIFWIHKLFGHQGYHNEFVWPWVTLQNIQVKIKIALQHRDQATRDKYKQQAVDDLLAMAKLFMQAGGAYEIFKPDEPIPAATTFYTPPKNLMGNLSAYMGAFNQLKALGWL